MLRTIAAAALATAFAFPTTAQQPVLLQAGHITQIEVIDFRAWARSHRQKVELTDCLSDTEEVPCAIKDHWLKQLSPEEVEKYLKAGEASKDKLIAHVMRYLSSRQHELPE